MRPHNAIELLQVGVEHLGVGSMARHGFFGGRSRFERIQARKGVDAALREDHIAVAIRITHAAFVGEHGSEFAGRIENIRKLLRDPPGVFAPAAIIVVAAAHPVQSRGVQDVAPLIEERAVSTAVHGDFAVAMEFAPHDVVRAVGSCLIFANRFCPIDFHALPRGGRWRSFRLRKRDYRKNLVSGTKIEVLAPDAR